MIINNELLQKNLIGLSVLNPSTALKISNSNASDNIKFCESKSGITVPYYDKEGKSHFIHSKFDPVKEGQKIAEHYGKPGLKIVFGLGGAFHLYPFLTAKKITAIIILEKDPAIVKSLFQVFDYSYLFSNVRVHFLVDINKEQFVSYLVRTYLPSIHGDLEVVSLQTQINYNKEYYTRLFPAINDAIEIISDDFTVQSYFGKKWFSNAVHNLVVAENNTHTLGPIRNAAVIAAGPSLEKQIDYLLEIRDDLFLIATDTSLPFLLHKKIEPDCVISIDCQHITYHHFMKGFPANIPLVLDISSPRLFNRYSNNTLFFGSTHPFSRYINKYWRQFPEVDISGGNVTHAALSLASRLGARKAYLFGADFSYPDGKIYARSTYLYDYFEKSQSKKNPLLHQCLGIVFRNSSIVKIRNNKKIRYTTKPMINYKNRLESFAGDLPMNIIPVPGDGETINLPANIKRSDSSRNFFGSGKEKQELKIFLYNYIKILKSLNTSSVNLSDLYNSLSSDKQEVFKTILPVLSVFIRQKPNESNVDLYIQAVKWMKEQTEKVLHHL